MPLNLPNSATDVASKSKIDVQRELNQSEPFLKNHWLLAIVTANANRVFDFYLQLKQAIRILFIDTSYGTYLSRWASIWGKTLTPATKANGNVVATGLAGFSVPNGTTIVLNGKLYTSTSGATLSSVIAAIASLERSGTTVTATTTSPHGLSNNVEVSISGAVETEYNVGAAEITITGEYTFTYEIVGSPSTPATGSPVATYVSASVPVESDDFGSDQNADAGSLASLQSPIVGVSSSLGVDFGAIGGGTNQESEESLRDRTLTRIRNPIAHFSKADIIDKAKEVAGVTRVFVREAGYVIGSFSISSLNRSGQLVTAVSATPHGLSSGDEADISGATETEYNGLFPVIVLDANTFYYIVSGSPSTPATGTIEAEAKIALGTTTVYFTRDNDDSLIPTGSEVITVKNKLLEILPANTSEDDLTVSSPVAVPVDFTFSDLTPGSSGMRAAVIANIEQFFRENTEVGVDIDQDAYRAAIYNSVDPDTGATVQTFSLSSPGGDITIATGEIGILGNVIFT